MEIHWELGKGHDDVIYKDALVVELSQAQVPFLGEENYEITYEGA
jgi:GxxExxY protein